MSQATTLTTKAASLSSFSSLKSSAFIKRSFGFGGFGKRSSLNFNTATTTSSLTRKQQKQSRRRAGNQITRASSANVEKPKDSPPPTSSATATNPPTPPKKEDRKIVNGQDVPSFEDISTAHFRISSGTFPLSLPFSFVSVDERFGGYQFSFSSKWVH